MSLLFPPGNQGAPYDDEFSCLEDTSQDAEQVTQQQLDATGNDVKISAAISLAIGADAAGWTSNDHHFNP